MSIRARVALAGLGSFALLLAALGFQFIGGLAPCHLCLLQRWPHLAAVIIAAGALAGPVVLRRPLAFLGAAAAALASGLGVYHAGVELGWWPGPSSCVGADPAGLTPAELFDQLANAPLVRCDAVVWEFLGLSMAGWNAVLSAVLVLLWLSAALARPKARTI